MVPAFGQKIKFVDFKYIHQVLKEVFGHVTVIHHSGSHTNASFIEAF